MDLYVTTMQMYFLLSFLLVQNALLGDLKIEELSLNSMQKR